MNDFEDDLHVDLTPLIDVIFMLVIFFIMTMSFTLPVIDIVLPSSSTAEQTQKSNNIVITVNKDGEYLYKERVISAKELKDILLVQDDATIELNIDGNSKTQILIDIADIARSHTDGRLIINTIKADN
ncbi:biopolymer transport protein ExbD [Anaerobiospirillum thomasii]|uniref:Biopolymer transport protein ExbD n=1 Tax=Anaerobiospirillum thomasii TaxID=179995 RepID=A0A2X0V8J7_9GAMM|nr:biopolymer transporter ExbD [Anaerobiospirillum thomasii]SPT69125.1 biopolymer transport protein ExbD [Anaerobiospirillum thomasii]SPT72323.1 biopolymer transport protein ExbD [Anaerobiospirillum thomasii]